MKAATRCGTDGSGGEHTMSMEGSTNQPQLSIAHVKIASQVDGSPAMTQSQGASFCASPMGEGTTCEPASVCTAAKHRHSWTSVRRRLGFPLPPPPPRRRSRFSQPQKVQATRVRALPPHGVQCRACVRATLKDRPVEGRSPFGARTILLLLLCPLQVRVRCAGSWLARSSWLARVRTQWVIIYTLRYGIHSCARGLPAGCCPASMTYNAKCVGKRCGKTRATVQTLRPFVVKVYI